MHAVVALLIAAVSCLTIAPAAVAAPAAPTAHQAPAPNPSALPEQPSWAPFVDQLYQAILHRSADPGGSQYWGDVMGFVTAVSGSSSAAATYVSSHLARTSEAAAARVSAAYQTLLGRAPDSGGLTTWTAFLVNGNSVEQLWARIVSYPEFRQHASSTANMVSAIYKTVLGRWPDNGGLQFWTAFLDGGGSPSALVSALTRSSEYATKLVTDTYQQALLRTPDAGGLQHWAAQVKAGTTDAITLLATLAGTAESVNYGCDPTGPGACLLPFPNDRYTTADSSTATGKRVAMKPSWTPANASGVHIDTQELNRSDGFSPGAAAIVQVPGLDLGQMPDAPRVDTPSFSTESSSPIMVIDASTGEQWPVWAELDQFANAGANPTLFIRPATNYIEGHTYVVVLRSLKTSTGASIAAPPVFKAYLDGTDLPGVAGFEANKPYMNNLIGELGSWGISHDGLYLAWQFTVASTANITGRLLHIRDDAFGRIGGADGLTNDAAPSFAVTSNTANPYTGIAREVVGTFQVPSYLTGGGAPGTVFDTGADGLPQYSGQSITAQFDCIIPTQALDTPGIPSIYGHGLFGSMSEVHSQPQRDMATRFGRVYCATPWIGMSSDDLGTAAAVLGDLSKFDELADRVQQGVLDMLFLGRLMNSPNGLVTNAAFQNGSGQGVIIPHELTYDGNSQGGILGGITTAVATDYTRAVLGVAAMNFSTLMDRSSDFTPFFAIMDGAYPARLDQVIAVDLIQMEWDRSEPDGYMAHVTNDPLPNTPSHHVLMQLAYGDHQVSNWASDVEVRTIGRNGNMAAECPAVSDPRRIVEWPLWNVPCIGGFPYDGSAVVYLDSGATPPPLGNVPPAAENPADPASLDPHSDPRLFPAMQDQKDQFLRPGGLVTQACEGPCVEAAG
jgi:hypothetical protein